MGNCSGCSGCGSINPEFDFLLGLTEKEADDELRDQGFFVRAVWEDGEHLICTADIRADRLNVAVEDGKIIRVFNFG